MNAYISLPSNSKERLPGLMVFQEAFGVNTHIRELSDRFAAEGYIVIAPELFHRTAPKGFEGSYTDFSSVASHTQAITESNLEADIKAVWEWLQSHPQVQQDNIACTGYCMGGRVSFLTNTMLPVKAAVSYYGARIVPDLIKRAPSLHAPMLFFWGGLDKHIPHEQIESITSELRKAGKQHINVEISYADHGFFCDKKAAYNADAASEAWALTLAFLKAKLEKK